MKKFILAILFLTQIVSASVTVPMNEDFLQLSDVTTNNFSTTKHGFVPKGTNVGNCLKDDGTWGSCAAPGGGEANTASNLGTGVGLYQTKSGVDLQFRSLKSSSGNLSITTSGTTEVSFGFSTIPTVDAFAMAVLGSDASTPSAGYETLYNKNGTLYTINSSAVVTQIPQFERAVARMTSTQTSSSTSHADVTELVTPSLSAGTYHFQLRGAYQTAATTTGIGLRVVAGTSTMSTVFGTWRIRQAAEGTDSYYEYAQLDQTVNLVSASVVAQNTNYPLLGDGFFILTVAGTVKVQFRSEVNASNAILQIGTSLIVQKVE